MDENKPNILNIEERMRQLILGINAMVSLSEYLTLEDKVASDSAFDELLKAMEVDMEAQFLKEFAKSGITGEA